MTCHTFVYARVPQIRRFAVASAEARVDSVDAAAMLALIFDGCRHGSALTPQETRLRCRYIGGLP